MAGNGRKKADSLVAHALASGATAEEAATQANVSIRTVFRRLQDPEFRKEVERQRSAMMSSATRQLIASSTRAVNTLVALLEKKEPATVRLGAARAILEYGPKLQEQSELVERIAALEERVSEAATTNERGRKHG